MVQVPVYVIILVTIIIIIIIISHISSSITHISAQSLWLIHGPSYALSLRSSFPWKNTIRLVSEKEDIYL